MNTAVTHTSCSTRTLDDQRNPSFLVMTMGSPGQDCGGPGTRNAGASLPSSMDFQRAARLSFGEMLPSAVKQIRHSLFPLPYPDGASNHPNGVLGLQITAVIWIMGLYSQSCCCGQGKCNTGQKRGLGRGREQEQMQRCA